MTATRLLDLSIRSCAGGAVLLGLALWLGYAWSLRPVHMLLGIGLVVSLWTLAVIAWRRGASPGLVAFAAAWGLVTWAFGMTQTRILPGPSHWIIQLAHLAIGMVAAGLGARIARAIPDQRPAAARPA